MYPEVYPLDTMAVMTEELFLLMYSSVVRNTNWMDVDRVRLFFV